MIDHTAFMSSVTILEHQQRIDAQRSESAIGSSLGKLARRAQHALRFVASLVA